MFRSLSTLALTVSIAAGAVAQTGRLQTHQTPDGKTEAYFCVDPYMKAALDEMSEFFPRTQAWELRGPLDVFLPPALKDLRYHPADDLMQEWSRLFFEGRNETTGLITRGGPPSPPNLNSTVQNFSECMMIRSIDKAAELLKWSPEDEVLRAECLSYADAVWKYFRWGGYGLWDYVRADTGAPESDFYNVIEPSLAARGLCYIGTITGEKKWVDEALKVIQWNWSISQRMHSDLPLESLSPFGVTNYGTDTDGIYWIRNVLDCYDITKEQAFLDIALASGKAWTDLAWWPEYHHFARHIDHDGVSNKDPRLYGDGPYNTFELMVRMFTYTGEQRYMDLFDEQWGLYAYNEIDGFMPNAFDAGHVVDTEPDVNQNIYIQLLLGAYEATKDTRYLEEAKMRADRLLPAPQYWRRDGFGQCYIELARALDGIVRLEAPLSARGSVVRLVPAGGADPIFEQKVDADVVVLYVNPGRYEMWVGNRSQAVNAEADELGYGFVEVPF